MPEKSNNKLKLTLQSIHDYEELHWWIDVFDFYFLNWHITFQGIASLHVLTLNESNSSFSHLL